MNARLVINEDNSHFFGSRTADQMTMAGLHAFIDTYADTAVTHMFLCPNAMRASFRSRTRDAIWEPVGDREPTGRWPQNAKLLHERGLDPYAVWIARCRETGLSPWLSMRMNDIHSVNEPDNFMHSSFWREHPEYWRVPHGSAAPWQNRAMNYRHEEVRAHQFAFVEELLERYDPDGIELDWMRFGYHLTPGRERDEAEILTAFVRRVRQLVDETAAARGHRIGLSVRVPAHPDAAAGLGMDGSAWAVDGLVDILVPCPFWSSSDFDIPVEQWRERLGGAVREVLIMPGLEHNVRPWPGGAAVANDLACARGFAAVAWHRGADGIYLFNWMDSGTRPVSGTQYAQLLAEGLGATTVLTPPRRHPVCYRDTVPSGFPNGVCLPAELGEQAEFRVYLVPTPEDRGGAIVVGLAGRDGLEDAQLTAMVNGRPAGPMRVLESAAGLGGKPARAVALPVPPGCITAGVNTIVIRQADGVPSQQVVWVEVRF